MVEVFIALEKQFNPGSLVQNFDNLNQDRKLDKLNQLMPTPDPNHFKVDLAIRDPPNICRLLRVLSGFRTISIAFCRLSGNLILQCDCKFLLSFD